MPVQSPFPLRETLPVAFGKASEAEALLEFGNLKKMHELHLCDNKHVPCYTLLKIMNQLDSGLMAPSGILPKHCSINRPEPE